jgi:hypothetical protein
MSHCGYALSSTGQRKGVGAVGSSVGGNSFGRRHEEFIADFELIARRTLDDLHHRLFRLHVLGGYEAKTCCRTLHIERGNFFHALYRLQEQLGKAFAETQPYCLFPLTDYLHRTAIHK